MAFTTWLFTAFARRQVRKVLRTRPLLGAETQEGTVVVVEGVVRALAPVTAPLSGVACAAYSARIFSSVVAPQRRGERARTILSQRVVVSPFLLERGAASSVIVDGTHARFDVPEVQTKLDPARVDAFLLAHGVPLAAWRPRVAEWIVEDGMRVRVAGVLMRDAASEPDAGEREFREAPPAELRLTGTFDHPLAIGLAR